MTQYATRPDGTKYVEGTCPECGTTIGKQHGDSCGWTPPDTTTEGTSMIETTEVTRPIVGMGLTVMAVVASDGGSGATAEEPADEPEVTEITDISIDDPDAFAAWLYTKIDLNEYVMEAYRERLL